MVAKITLDVGSTNDVSEELYDLLLEAFVRKSKEMGLDPEAVDVALDDWHVECVLRKIG
jgi:hypothetical protein